MFCIKMAGDVHNNKFEIRNEFVCNGNGSAKVPPSTTENFPKQHSLLVLMGS